MSSTPSPLTDSTPYVVIDTHTGAVVYRTTYSKRKLARRVADKRDLAYGAVRFVCKVG